MKFALLVEDSQFKAFSVTKGSPDYPARNVLFLHTIDINTRLVIKSLCFLCT